jgi:predicted  nucleic acid-binding Zn-ribbon protein
MTSQSATFSKPNDTPLPAATPVTVTVRQGGAVSSVREIAKVQADYLALANDLEQAQSLASALELQLSGKSNELARSKMIWEKAQADLAKFAQDLGTMRAERHSLANEAQRGYAFELKFEKLSVAHEELAKKAERLEAELAAERAAHEQTRAEVEQLKNQRARPVPGGPAVRGGTDPELRGALESLRAQLDRVLGGKVASVAPAAKAATEHIEIQFGS